MPGHEQAQSGGPRGVAETGQLPLARVDVVVAPAEACLAVAVAGGSGIGLLGPVRHGMSIARAGAMVRPDA